MTRKKRSFWKKLKRYIPISILIGIVSITIGVLSYYRAEKHSQKHSQESREELEKLSQKQETSLKKLEELSQGQKQLKKMIKEALGIPINILSRLKCLSNPTTVKGKIANGVLMDSCDVLVSELKDMPPSTGTIQMWVKFNQDYSTSNRRYLFDLLDSLDEYNNRISLYLQPDKVVTLSIFEGDDNSFQIRENLNSNELSDWLYFIVTWNASNGLLNLYINGKLRKSRGISHIHFTSGFKRFFMGSNFRGRDQVNGVIDEVRISKVVRSKGWVWNSYLSGSNAWGSFGKEESIEK
ncbi:hypothetical protein KAW50_05620 [candidate division WOR-3 bacterium]|nr:hypothetical protein [candidate division WOR-3 bacterium]